MTHLHTHLPIADRASVVKRIVSLVRLHRRCLLAIVILHVAAVLAGLAPPVLFGLIIDRLSQGRVSQLNSGAVLILAALLLHGVLAYVAAGRSFQLGESIFADLREDFVEGVLDLPFQEVEAVGTGEVLSRSTSDMDAIHDVIRIGLPETVVGTLTTVLTIAAAFVVNPLVALGCLAGLPWIIVATRRYVRDSPAAFGQELAGQADVSTRITETVRGHQTVDALDIGGQRHEAFLGSVDRAKQASHMPVTLQGRWFPAVQIGYHLPVLVVLAWGTWLVRHGQADIGEVAALAIYMQAILTPLDDLIYWFGEVQSAAAALGRIFGVDKCPQPSTSDLVSRHNNLKVDRVRFGYLEGVEVLHGVDLDVAAGERVAIVGTSGAGKSTLAMLVAGLQKPTSGTVWVGGVALSELDPERLPDHVALVTQEDHVFYGSVRDNLTLAAPDASEEGLWEALRAAGAHAWVRGLESGLDQAVGDDSYAPTVEQARQLALARLLLKRPRVLVLDEATAALSRADEVNLRAYLDSSLRDRTVIQVVHNLDAAALADRIVVMDDGKIVEQGPHATLVQGGVYARLWQAWSTGSTDEYAGVAR